MLMSGSCYAVVVVVVFVVAGQTCSSVVMHEQTQHMADVGSKGKSPSSSM